MKYEFNNCLVHHGIKGQKWGVRNGPPYPVDKKATAYSGSNKPTINRNLMETKIKELDSTVIKKGIKYVSLYKAKNFLAKKIESAIKIHRCKQRIKGYHDEDSDMAAVNSKRKKSNDEKYSYNCVNCSAVYELRRRGYDVKAARSEKGINIKTFMKWFGLKKEDVKMFESYGDFSIKLNNQPNDSRGAMFIRSGKYSSPHCMVWEKQNGKLIVRDIQKNVLYNSLNESTIDKNVNKYIFIRTDNAKIDWKEIIDAVE